MHITQANKRETPEGSSIAQRKLSYKTQYDYRVKAIWHWMALELLDEIFQRTGIINIFYIF